MSVLEKWMIENNARVQHIREEVKEIGVRRTNGLSDQEIQH